MEIMGCLGTKLAHGTSQIPCVHSEMHVVYPKNVYSV